MRFVNSKQVPYYLHKRRTIIGRNKAEVDTYFFKKEKGEGYCSLPVGFTVVETPSGLPVIKRI